MTPEDLAEMTRRLNQEELLISYGFEPLRRMGVSYSLGPEQSTRNSSRGAVPSSLPSRSWPPWTGAIVHLPTMSIRPISKVDKRGVLM